MKNFIKIIPFLLVISIACNPMDTDRLNNPMAPDRSNSFNPTAPDRSNSFNIIDNRVWISTDGYNTVYQFGNGAFSQFGVHYQIIHSADKNATTGSILVKVTNNSRGSTNSSGDLYWTNNHYAKVFWRNLSNQSGLYYVEMSITFPGDPDRFRTESQEITSIMFWSHFTNSN